MRQRLRFDLRLLALYKYLIDTDINCIDCQATMVLNTTWKPWSSVVTKSLRWSSRLPTLCCKNSISCTDVGFSC